MKTRQRRGLAVLVLAVTTCSSLALDAQAASAFPAGDFVVPFNYTVNASTHLKTLNQTITVPPGKFVGGIDLYTGALVGNISLPPAKFTFKLAGVLPLVTATAKIASTKPVTGNLDVSTFVVTATATFNIRILSAYATGTTVNLVGNSCETKTAVTVTMSGDANFGSPSTFSGTYTLPDLQNCGLATTALNLVLPGPGNTFTAIATSN
jgi:hypothetical protein